LVQADTTGAKTAKRPRESTEILMIAFPVAVKTKKVDSYARERILGEKKKT
jgi:hypothetical protein